MLLVFLILMAACYRFELTAEEFPSAFELQVYDGIQLGDSKTISVGDPYYESLKRWYAKNRAGWTADIASYAPSIKLRSEAFWMDISLAARRVVVNHRSADGVWRQLSKRVGPDALDELAPR